MDHKAGISCKGRVVSMRQQTTQSVKVGLVSQARACVSDGIYIRAMLCITYSCTRPAHNYPSYFVQKLYVNPLLDWMVCMVSLTMYTLYIF